VSQKKAKLILSKRAILDIAGRHMDTDPDVAVMAAMAEEQRKSIRQGKKPKKRKRKAKPHLKPTDHLSLEQFARIMDVVQSKADTTKARNKYINRAAINEMLIIVMVESGLRVSEVCNLRLKSLPSYHEHQVLEVLNDKGQKDRVVGISDYLAQRLGDYVRRYHKGHGIESYLFRSENGGRLSTASVYAKVKVIGLKTRIWLYPKNGHLKTKLSPHKFRHTCATHLLDVTGNQGLVQDQLGHEDAKTTRVYARTLIEKKKSEMNAFSEKLRSRVAVRGG